MRKLSRDQSSDSRLVLQNEPRLMTLNLPSGLRISTAESTPVSMQACAIIPYWVSKTPQQDRHLLGWQAGGKSGEPGHPVSSEIQSYPHQSAQPQGVHSSRWELWACWKVEDIAVRFLSTETHELSLQFLHSRSFVVAFPAVWLLHGPRLPKRELAVRESIADAELTVKFVR